jgi:hypothetical protein
VTPTPIKSKAAKHSEQAFQWLSSFADKQELRLQLKGCPQVFTTDEKENNVEKISEHSPYR